MGNDIITNNGGKATILGGVGNDEITGGSNGDSISGSFGDDTLNGGAGNDTLTGGNGKDLFIYESGNDTITDYAMGDKIELSSGTISEYSYSGNDLVFKIGSGSLTLKNAKGKKITVNDETKTYPVNDTNAKTYDLLYDNNFMTDDFALDDITEQKFEVTQIQNSTTEIAQDDKTLITFTEK